MIRLVFAFLCFCTAVKATEQPNVVIILADDLGWNSVGWHNREVMKTPNLDRLCAEGIELDRFYVSPMCSPTRAGLLTGRYPIRYGRARAVISPWREVGLPASETTLAEALSEVGYERRGIFGKWHLGHWKREWQPNSRGFTDFVGCYNGAIDYFTRERDGELDWHRNDEPLQVDGYITELTGQDASAFIREAAKGEAPYLCYIPFNAPHNPNQVPEKYLEHYKGIEHKNTQIHFAMITAMDEAIGQILEAIEDTGEADDTIVWFFSDNGAHHSIKGGNAPLNGGKLTTYEGGVRVPACVRYPKWDGGRKLSQRMVYTDIAPTVLELAGVDTGALELSLDGVDLGGVLSGREETIPERDLYFYHGQPGRDKECYSVISGDWKLVINGPDIVSGRIEGQRVELFKLDSDPNESEDLASVNPETTERLFGKLVTFRRLQPEDSIPPYLIGAEGFVAPKDWLIAE
ncbi:sulfatase-like hydrolase/transferase [Pelagicoccus mobilis]|uniref:Sulfatase-like hydrolase/transferase n=1 Tax=Pelagicoccus mobilis TaxID=415221 RepID=A0A934S1G7_9BACT|nr:sulfatase-like hydrolase/transferase [Pelagicoccus mobilis]MBK1877704.1 sulfatase-like hydrolase/transferase [Pelagicoccus mobilis]